ncbi:SGNH/GDSL hydrolase family protein [Patescibacteria group bacterium]|nr:SGNH/GDSL hydrolase family protein [Patescibacteria group bacterium]
MGFVAAYFIYSQSNKPQPKFAAPKAVNVLGKEKVKYPQDHTIVMVGDSMTETLGNSDELKKFLSDYYSGKSFEVLNYGFGATNILSVMDRVTQETEHGRKFRPIEEIDYDLILLESFGQNPLSEYKLEEGLQRQTQELDKIVSTLKETNPRAKIVFVATISPNKVIFAQNQVDLSATKRVEWVQERIAYMKNHIAYANSHNIPVVNIFEKSLLENGDGNPDYISTDDYIHPSPTGIVFISRQIADFIYNNSIFPH